ncbi:MAG: NAD-dependent epimerase/dehydratase family protein [Burkholderiaceae bacterium]|nr:NAD-dependent epimerase/dehydratase family protein [Burkholderiaceae bacterium]
MASILVTGAAGFIGAHAAAALARAGHRVVGCDNFDAYYSPALKHARVRHLLDPLGVAVEVRDICAVADLDAWFARQRFEVVLHLAAQAGVRHSLHAPMAYVRANLLGFASILEASRRHGVAHLLYASSSSVYGQREAQSLARGFREDDRSDRPASFYAATKQANEAMAHATAAVHGLPVTGLRFFTVYGPWGRPDMACWTFTERIRRGQTLQLYGQGQLLRDFTWIGDVTDAITRLVARGPGPVGAGGIAAEVLNVGHHRPVRVLDFVRELERALQQPARIELADMPPGDVALTCADPARLIEAIGPWEATPLHEGLQRFAQWWTQWEASSRTSPDGPRPDPGSPAGQVAD